MAGRYPPQWLDELRARADIVKVIGSYVTLKKNGHRYVGLCPFHNETAPSFSVDEQKQVYHCFGCKAGGSVIQFVMDIERLSFPEAVAFLADQLHMPLPEMQNDPAYEKRRTLKERIYLANRTAARMYHQLLWQPESSAILHYLQQRGLSDAVIRRFGIGAAPPSAQVGHRLVEEGFTEEELVQAGLMLRREGRTFDMFRNRAMFPIIDTYGNVLGFGGRAMGDAMPKYLNTSETPIFHKSSNMFGIDIAKSAIVSSGEAIVVEGYTDVIAMHQAGIANVVATLGTALTAQHVKLISRFATRIVYLFDGDAAGQKAADRASEFIDWQSAVESRRDPIDLRVAVLPDGKDPAEFLAAYDAAAMRDAIAAAEPLLAFSINRCIERYDLRRPENKARAMTEALQILYPIKDSVSATDYVNIIADRLNVEYTAVFKALKETKAPMAARHQNDQAVSEPQPNAVNPVAEQIIEADQQSARMEYGLIALVVTDAHLLDYIEKDLVRIRWMDQAAESMADALMTIDHEASAAQALASVQGACPDASTLLAQAMIETEDGEERLFQARLMIRTLRERDLERSIRDAKARMRTESGLSADELDRLFEQTVSMQKELVRLRSNAPDDLKD